MSHPAGSSNQAPHGSLAQEVAKLLELAQQWLGERSYHAPGPSTDAAEVPADGVPDYCRTCPICRLRRLVAELEPEAFEHLAAAAASMGAALKAMGTDDKGADVQSADDERGSAP